MAPLLAMAIPSLVKLLPDVAGWFGGDKAEQMTSEVLDIASSVTGISDKNKALEAINADPNVALKFQEAVMADKYRLDEIYLADRKDARDMQKEALRQEDTFSKRFIYYLASAWSIFAMIYLVGITFFTVPESAVRFADTTLGFLLATIISGIIQFFFGSSKGSKDKNEITAELLRKSKNQ
jgi:hypothetical protein